MEHAQLTILDEINARLANISKTNEYEVDIEPNSIVRAQLTPFQNGDLPAINYWPIPESLDSKTGQMETRILPVSIETYDFTHDFPFTDLAFKRANNIITALFRATAAPKVSDIESIALGGLVSSLVVQAITPMIGQGNSPWYGALIELEIKYNIKVGDFSTIQNF